MLFVDIFSNNLCRRKTYLSTKMRRSVFSRNLTTSEKAHRFSLGYLGQLLPKITEQEMSQTRDECPQRNWVSIRHI